MACRWRKQIKHTFYWRLPDKVLEVFLFEVNALIQLIKFFLPQVIHVYIFKVGRDAIDGSTEIFYAINVILFVEFCL
jgi:hypothetical protein